MANRIHYESSIYEDLARQLSSTASTLEQLQAQLHAIHMTKESGADLSLSINVREFHADDISVPGQATCEVYVRRFGNAAAALADHMNQMSVNVRRAAERFEEGSAALEEVFAALTHSVGSDQVVSFHSNYLGSKTVPIAATASTAGAASHGKIYTKAQAENVLDYLFGDKHVEEKKKWFFMSTGEYKVDDTVSDYWKVLTGDTEGWTDEEITATRREFAFVAQTLLEMKARGAKEFSDKMLRQLIGEIKNVWNSDPYDIITASLDASPDAITMLIEKSGNSIIDAFIGSEIPGANDVVKILQSAAAGSSTIYSNTASSVLDLLDMMKQVGNSKSNAAQSFDQMSEAYASAQVGAAGKAASAYAKIIYDCMYN